jgi:hypothetical protein
MKALEQDAADEILTYSSKIRDALPAIEAVALVVFPGEKLEIAAMKYGLDQLFELVTRLALADTVADPAGEIAKDREQAVKDWADDLEKP